MKAHSEYKLLVERRFRAYGSQGNEEALTWDDLAEAPVVVVLGEPGAGKSTELERQAERTPGAAFLSVRHFLHLSSTDSRPLFLDALDETRASGNDRNLLLLQVAQRLIQLGLPNLRLSCRAADWFGDLDHEDLA